MNMRKVIDTVKPFVVTIILIIISASLRGWPLGSLGSKIPWLTFYPSIMVAALYGGFYAGMFGAALTCLYTISIWPIVADQPILNDPADFLGMAVFFFNCLLIAGVSEAMRRAREKARRAQEQAETANKAKSVFLSNMSHELRTPLNAILGFARLMEHSNSISDEHKNYLAIITRSGEHLLDLINDILDIAKIESGKVNLKETNIVVKNALGEIRSLMEARAKEKGLSFQVAIADDFPVNIIIDEVKLKQILINLLGNAIKFTQEGYVKLKMLKVGEADEGRAKLRFEVEDSGTGIQAANLPLIFKAFYQIEGPTANEPGTGLGLAISKRYVELMNGEIGVTSTYGKGSLFYFEVPVKTTEGTVYHVQKTGRQVAHLAEGQQEYRILVAEDNEENRTLLQKLLSPLGFILQEAENGLEAVTLAKSWQPHLILMDMRMPVMGGIEAAQQIKQFSPLCKIIAVTAHALEEERMEILNSGCDDFIRKPYSENDILDKLAEHLKADYVYKQEEEEPRKTLATITSEELEAAGHEFINNLLSAVNHLDGKLCLELLQKNKGSIDATLSLKLQEMIEKIQYEELLNLLNNFMSKRR